MYRGVYRGHAMGAIGDMLRGLLGMYRGVYRGQAIGAIGDRPWGL